MKAPQRVNGGVVVCKRELSSITTCVLHQIHNHKPRLGAVIGADSLCSCR